MGEKYMWLLDLVTGPKKDTTFAGKHISENILSKFYCIRIL